MTIRTPFRIALLAGAIGCLTAGAANAQDDGNYRSAAYSRDGTETVIVNAPDEWMRRFPDGTVTLSREVSYSDLDLGTRDGMHALRERVRSTSADVCEELRDRTNDHDPLNQMDMRRCEREAYRHAMAQAREDREETYDR